MSPIQRDREILTGLLKAGRGGQQELGVCEEAQFQDEKFLKMGSGAVNTAAQVSWMPCAQKRS